MARTKRQQKKAKELTACTPQEPPAPAIQPAPDSPADRGHPVSSVATARPNNTANAGGESQTATSSQPEWLSFERFKLPDDILNRPTFDPAWNPRQELLRFYGDPPQDKESKAALSKALNPGQVRQSVLSALSVANGEGVLNASLRQLEFWVCSLWIAFGYRGECRPRLDAALNELAESGLIRVSPALGSAYGHRERVRVSLGCPDTRVHFASGAAFLPVGRERQILDLLAKEAPLTREDIVDRLGKTLKEAVSDGTVKDALRRLKKAGLISNPRRRGYILVS